MPVIVTVCGVAQFPLVNVSDETETVPSPASDVDTSKETSAEGPESKEAMNVAVPPASVVTSPPTGSILIPGGSSLTFVTLYCTGERTLNSEWFDEGVATTLYTMSLSARSSSTPVTVAC